MLKNSLKYGIILLNLFEMGYKIYTKEGITMIYLPESLERTLARIEDAYKRDIKKGRSYYRSITKDGKIYTGTDTVKVQLEYFKEFKASLENGTSKLLACEEGQEEKAKIRLMNAIWKYYEPLCHDDICIIDNDVYIQRGLRKRIESLSIQRQTQEEAKNLLGFLDDAHSSSWGQGDAYYKIRDFRLVKSKEEFEEILAKLHAEELTRCKNLLIDYTTIRVALVTVDWRTIYKKKGIYEDFQRLCKEHGGDMDFDDVWKMFNIWHDVRETAIYYIYAPKVEN